MNAILARSAHDHRKVLWEPFATSTPIKIVLKQCQTKIEDLLQKQLLSDSDNFIRKPTKRLSTSNTVQTQVTELKRLASKKIRKNKSSGYFDVSSSSSSDEDSGENQKRLIIKVSANKNSKSFLGRKKSESEDTQGVSKSVKVENSKNVKDWEEGAVPIVSHPKRKSGKVGNGKKKTKTKSVNTVPVSSDEECKIFDESNVVSGSKPVSQDKDNGTGDENLNKNEDPHTIIKTEKTKMPKTLLKSKKKDDVNPESQKHLPKGALMNNKPSKVLKRKGAVVTNKTENTKKSSAKDNPIETVVNEATQLHTWDNRTNLSHQLFSNSREQEFLNTLDLTSGEFNEPVESLKHSLWKKPKTTPTKKVTSTTKNKEIPSKDEETKQERPVRRKHKPKESWIPENKLPTQSVSVSADKETQSKRNLKSSSKLSSKLGTEQKEDILIEEIKENNHEGNKVTESVVRDTKGGKVKRKRGNILKEKKQNAADDAVVSSTNENKLPKMEADVDLEKIVKKDATGEQKPDSTDKTVFMQLNQLPFQENGTGCAVMQCQTFNNFKCGVLKLKPNSKFKCKTLHSNSHLGGVVVKGSIQMQISEKEMELKEGGIAFVPPLTDWQVTNISDSESVFYYWCGRFK